MKQMSVVAAIALLCLCNFAGADVFNLGEGLVNLETVLVGDPGNLVDPHMSGGGGYARYCGAVDYSYRIGTYEVTAAQYCDFLNHKAKSDPYGLWHPYMAQVPLNYTDQKGCNIQRHGVDGDYTYTVAADWANRPVNYVSYWSACRFTNWLHNGQADGDTETGAYTLNGYTGEDGRAIEREQGATWFLPSEDEWYKAAYYKGGSTEAGYWRFPMQSDALPSNDVLPTDPGNSANFVDDSDWSIGLPYCRTVVGEFENSAGFYGTYDLGGNVEEWNEALGDIGEGFCLRRVRGGSCEIHCGLLASEDRYNVNLPNLVSSRRGFRVAAAVPEPSSLVALMGALASMLALRRRRL